MNTLYRLVAAIVLGLATALAVYFVALPLLSTEVVGIVAAAGAGAVIGFVAWRGLAAWEIRRAAKVVGLNLP